MEAILIIGGEVRFDTAADPDAQRRIRETVGQLLQVKNLAVLMGSGASLHLGSPAIRDVQRTQLDAMFAASSVEPSALASSALDALVPDDGVDLEQLLAALSNSLAYAESAGRETVKIGEGDVTRDVLRELRRAVNVSLATSCDLPNPSLVKDERFKEDPWLAHREFFRRLLRSRRPDLPRVSVFTTNYDLVIERTLDDAGVPYFDGFVGTVDRVMRLDAYRHDLYLPPDGDGRRLVRVPNVLYLYKVHGSLNWRPATSPAGYGTSHVVQSARPRGADEDLALIYPTPHKESDVLGHPYADLLRVLSTTLSAPETAIVTVGYGFADDHINRLILQALPSNPTLQVLIVDPCKVVARDSEVPPTYEFGSSTVARLAQVRDQRLAVLTGDGVCFSTLAEVALPDPDDYALEQTDSLASAIEAALQGAPGLADAVADEEAQSP